MPLTPDENTRVFYIIGLKIAGIFLSFVGGVVTATWIVAGRVKGMENRLEKVEATQNKCQVETLGEIKKGIGTLNNKIDLIPDHLDMKLGRTHERIDELFKRDSGQSKR